MTFDKMVCEKEKKKKKKKKDEERKYWKTNGIYWTMLN